jgi:hypothetical protein
VSLSAAFVAASPAEAAFHLIRWQGNGFCQVCDCQVCDCQVCDESIRCMLCAGYTNSGQDPGEAVTKF